MGNGRSYEGTYAAAFEEDHIAGVSALFWNGSLVLQAPVALLDGLVATAVADVQRPIKRLIGPQRQVQAVLNQLNITPSAIQWDEPENLYTLHLKDLQAPQQLQDQQWQGRLMQAADIELITRWRVAYALEALGETESPELWQQMRAGLEKYLGMERVWILEDNGQPVATTAFNATIREMVQVGGVWTPPQLRSRGYGRAVVAASLLAVRDEGVQTAILFTGKDNIPAQKAYIALGFHHIGDYRITLLNI
jgi:predicted GNAT family acetyltransferase